MKEYIYTIKLQNGTMVYNSADEFKFPTKEEAQTECDITLADIIESQDCEEEDRFTEGDYRTEIIAVEQGRDIIFDYELEYIVSEDEMLSAIRKLKDGEEFWYRDYDGQGKDCISLYKRVTRTTIDKTEVYMMHMLIDGEGWCPSQAELVSVNDNPRYLKNGEMECGQTMALKEALEHMSEWRVYHRMFVVSADDFEQFFSNDPTL